MYVNEQAGLVYVANPRTASRAVGEALTTHAGFTMMGSHHSTDGIPDGALVFTAVRNHYDALVSLWYSMHGGLPFEPRFLDWYPHHIAFEYPHGRLFPYTDLADITVRYERLAFGVNLVLSMRRLGPIPVRRKGWGLRRRGRPYQLHYDPAMRAAVAERYGEEMEALGYDWEHV